MKKKKLKNVENAENVENDVKKQKMHLSLKMPKNAK
jgi:hypothetical protein